MPTPVTIEIQIDPESMNDYPDGSGRVYGPVDPEDYFVIHTMMEAFARLLERYGFVRRDMYIGLPGVQYTPENNNPIVAPSGKIG